MAAMGMQIANSYAMKNRRRTKAKVKRPSAPKARGRRNPSSTNANTKNALLIRERDEALERENATADVLRVISASPGDLTPVFKAILDNATRICDAKFGTLWLREFEGVRAAAFHRAPPAWANKLGSLYRPGSSTPLRQAIDSRHAIQIADLRETIAYAEREPVVVDTADLAGVRTLLSVPLLKDDVVIGVIGIYRAEIRLFTDRQIELVKNFAAQAVIAIENTRLLNELRQRTDDLTESLEQQTATSEVLGVISSSPGELEPVFDALLANAVRICGAQFGNLTLFNGGELRLAAMHNAPRALAKLRRRNPVIDLERSIAGPVVTTKQVNHVRDLAAQEPYAGSALAKVGGARTALSVPMLREDTLVGTINIYHLQVRPFTEKQIEFLHNFAAQAVIAIENTRLLSELRESLEQQTATSEVLKVISSSPGDLEPVFQAMLENATRICEANFGVLNLHETGTFRVGATHNVPSAFADFLHDHRYGYQPTPGGFLERVMRTKKVSHSADNAAETASRATTLGGARSAVCVPMLKDDVLVGTFTIYRQEVRPFTDKQIDLVKNFAAQAVIAIENTRLLNELRRSLEQQTATADVLRVISSSPGKLDPVFQAMLANAVRICDAKFGVMFRYDRNMFDPAATFGVTPEYAAFLRQRGSFEPRAGSGLDRLLQTKDVVRIADDAAGPTGGGGPAALGGARSRIVVPMLKDAGLVGAITIYRQEVRPFTNKQIELVQNFAAQAVIAIENTRLLNELRESLQQQTATSEVLSVISSSPGELEPVFQIMLANAVRICDAKFGILFRYENEAYDPVALFGLPPVLEEFLRQQRGSFQAIPGSLLDRIRQTKKLSHTADYAAEPAPGRAVTLGGARSTVDVPMLKDNVLVGVISIYRQEVRPFTDKQIELVQNFAAQAVIAIENTRLLNELRESLEQQTATSKVLSVISSSPGELEPVFQAMLENAVRICDSKFGVLFRYEEYHFMPVAQFGLPPALAEFDRTGRSFTPNPGTILDCLVQRNEVVHIADDASASHPSAAARLGGARSIVSVPMFKEGALVGAINIYRQEVRPFTGKQIALVANFADQAVIAIENTRLLSELRQSLEQQTATAEVLSVISSSPGDLQPIFNVMLENATRICQARFGVLSLREDDAFRVVSMHNAPAAFVELRRRAPTFQPSGRMGELMEQAFATKRAVQLADIAEDLASKDDTLTRSFSAATEARSIILVPLIKENEVIGSMAVFRQEVRPFNDKQVGLLTNFAAQAVIAIENTRLLNELRQRTEDLSKSLDDLRTAQDRLVQTQKLASLGQLTAGIAHEIKNPLNFVNNFSGVSVELIEELQETLGRVTADDKTRGEIVELTDTIRDNLNKIVQHGKRADSIVKNMLLHSREGSGERRSVDVNALVEESLNLAYHGARAETQSFNVTLERSFDPTAGEVDAFPQEITRVLLNLISNGFYAATKRQGQESGNGFEPIITAATKSLGGRVEIRIRDNGTGIPPEVRERMFNPFFTTKPAGEGTGLGLSISHDIIVKQHSGSIEVDTEPGQFTEFKIILPRTTA